MFYSKFDKKRLGFTLIELSVVIAIITILATISIPNVRLYLKKARDSKRISDIQVLALAFESFYDDNGHYPGVTDSALITGGGECLGIVGRGIVPTSGGCVNSGAEVRNDGGVDVLLRTYIHGPVPHDPSFDNNPNYFYYTYDPIHAYEMPTSVNWIITEPPTYPTPMANCVGPMYPHAGNPGGDNLTAVLAVNRFETNTIDRHRDVCSDGDLLQNQSDYNIAFSEVGFGF
ncbi:MAG: prepilin-type N-terminal cleavage/methylation domain-containing protein [Candidatus Omnitrophica bacterium]|nr:prepilin-type N-terminal cleavage/methylation domain-containing protein [Candidatus Omnitrophota bacterium]